MVWAVEDESDLMHVADFRFDIRAILENKNETIAIAIHYKDHARLIVRGAIMRGHERVAVHVKHRDHFVRRTSPSQPARTDPSEIVWKRAVAGRSLPASFIVPSHEPTKVFILSNASVFSLFDSCLDFSCASSAADARQQPSISVMSGKTIRVCMRPPDDCAKLERDLQKRRAFTPIQIVCVGRAVEASIRRDVLPHVLVIPAINKIFGRAEARPSG